MVGGYGGGRGEKPRKYGVKRGIWWWWWWLSGWLSGWWLSVVGKRLKVLEEVAEKLTPHRIAGSVSARGAGCVYCVGTPTLRVSRKNS